MKNPRFDFREIRDIVVTDRIVYVIKHDGKRYVANLKEYMESLNSGKV